MLGGYTSGMADKKRIVKQWLETDAAFGVAEVPVPKKKAGKSGGAKAAASATPLPAKPKEFAPQRAPAPVAMGRPAARPAVEVRETPVAAPVRAVAPAVRAGGVDIPGPPAGAIGDLPKIDRAEKLRRLAALLEETTRALAQYLNEIATRVVFGEGDVDAAVMFIGEGPGVEEDRLGRPFVGKSGQLLDKQIGAMGYKREEVFIGNVVKLRAAEPSEEWGGKLKDRPPTPEEVARNIVYLHRQIEIIRPKAIVTLGAPALKYVTGSKEGITRIRGQWLDYRGIPVMPTFHPAYVLRNYTEDTRRKVWDDLKMVMVKVGKKAR